MKLTKFLVLMAFALGLASAAARYSVTLPDATSVGGTHLKAGDYKVEMEGNQAKVLSGGNVVAEAPASLEKDSKKNTYTSLESANSQLEQIHLGGTDEKIVFKASGPQPAGKKK